MGERELRELGYTTVRLGSGASFVEMERVARPLLGLPDAGGGGAYNGAGAVARPTLDGASFLDASVGAPSSISIKFHNEMAYAATFPRRVAFAMHTPAETDGATTLVDNAQLTALLSPALRRRTPSPPRMPPPPPGRLAAAAPALGTGRLR